MAFHRLTVPTYLGGLPSGYDYINNALAGTPAPADGAKVGGTNAGTYFDAFGEDATSSNANRGNQALAQNCDFLDNVVSGELPAIAEVTGSSGVGLSSVVISDTVFVGKSGTTNDQYNRNRLVAVVDPTTDRQIVVSGSPVEILLIHDGSSNNQVGVPPSGFYANPTVNFSPALPASTSYKLLYAKKSTLVDVVPNKTIPDAFVKTALRSVVREMFLGGSNWYDSTANPAATVDAQLKKVITDLAGVSGSAKVGSDAIAASFTDAPYSFTADSIYGQLEALLGIDNDLYRQRTITGAQTVDNGGFKDSTIFLNPSTNFALTLVNPAGANKGRRILLQDVSGDMSNPTKSVTVARYTGTNLNGSANNVVLAADYGQWWLVSDGAGWYIA